MQVQLEQMFNFNRSIRVLKNMLFTVAARLSGISFSFLMFSNSPELRTVSKLSINLCYNTFLSESQVQCFIISLSSLLFSNYEPCSQSLALS